MSIEFLSTLAVIASDPPASRKLYVETLGLPLEGHGGDYYHSEQIAGCKSFEIWPLSEAAEACFGTPQWPVERPVPQVSIEFDVADAAAVGPLCEERRAKYRLPGGGEGARPRGCRRVALSRRVGLGDSGDRADLCAAVAVRAHDHL